MSIFIPFAPISDMQESREFLTDLISVIAGETRIAVREYPRSILTYNYIFEDKEIEKYVLAKLLAFNTVEQTYKIPYWQELTYIGTVASGSLNIPLDTRYLEIEEGSECVLWEGYDKYELLTVESFTDTEVIFTTATILNFSKAIFATVKTGEAFNGFTVNRNKNNVLTASLVLTCEYTYYNPVFPSGDTFQELKILSNTLVQEEENSRYFRNMEVFDSTVGKFARVSLENYNRISYPISFAAFTKEDTFNLKRQFDYLRGREKAFWLSSRWIDIKPLASSITSGRFPTLEVETFGGIVYPPEYVKIVGDTIAYAKIDSITEGTDSELITFAEYTLITVTGITSLEVLNQVRLDSDSISFKITKGREKLNTFAQVPVISTKSIFSANAPIYDIYGFGIGYFGDGAARTVTSPELLITITDMLLIDSAQSNGYINNSNNLFVIGPNTAGELGLGDTTSRTSFVQAEGKWKDIKFGVGFTIGIKTDGTLWHCGSHTKSQDGSGTTSGNNLSWMQIGTDTDWEAIEIGNLHCLALKTSSTLYAWGENDNINQCGQGSSSTYVSSPTAMVNGTNVIAFKATGGGSIVIKSDHTLWACGKDYTNGTNSTNVSVLTQVGSDLYDKIDTGTFSSLGVVIARKLDKSVVIWGYPLHGTPNSKTPIDFDTGQLYNEIQVCRNQSSVGAIIGIKEDGTLWGMGSWQVNGLGQSSGTQATMAQIGSYSDWVGLSSHYQMTFAWR